MKEIWRDIPGYEGIYQASSIGRVRSYRRLLFVRDWLKNGKYYGGNILTPFICKTGYYAVNFVYGGRKQHLLHRLIALTFIPKNNDRPHVNHKDCDKSNNSIENLEWCTPKENIRHSCANGLNGRLVINTQTGIYYNSAVEALESGCNCSLASFHKKLLGVTKNDTNFVYA